MLLQLIKAARPVTLIASVSPVMVGCAIAYHYNHKLNLHINLYLLLCIMICALMLQIASNYLNDAIDFYRGADTSERIGPQRVSQSNELSPKIVYGAGISCLLLALIFGIPLVLSAGVPVLIIGLTSILFAYTYTGGPFPLSYHGLGEIFAISYYGIVAVAGTVFILLGEIPAETWVRGLQVGFFATALIALNNYRDIEQDRKSNKKTLAVRFGKDTGRKIVVIALITPLIIEIFYSYYRITLAIIPLLYSLRAANLIFKLTPSAACNPMLGKISKLEFLYSLALSITYIITA